MTGSLLRSLSALAVLVLGVSSGFAEVSPAVPSLPLSFEQNQGQVASHYPFLFRHNGTEALFEPGGIDLQFPASGTRAGSHLRLRLLGESAGVSLHSELPLSGRTNYLLGPDAARWLRGIPTFSRIRYTAVYPGVDLVFYGNDSRLEHDFHIAPGADANRIAFHLDGAETLTLSPAGDLHVATGGDLLVLQRPSAYQEGTHGRVPVSTTFALAHDGTLTFDLGPYDHTRELVIDPVLTYATYLDKLSLGVAGIATDSTGATYITGYTFLTTFGTTAGAYQTTCPACANNKPAAFITKLDPTGTKVIYSTFLGGSDYTQPFAIAVDAKGNALIGGRTEATDYPVKNNVGSGAFSQSGSFAFVSSLTPDGSALNFSSVFAGDADSVVTCITTDGTDNVFLAGVTGSSSHPVTPGALNAGTPSFGSTYGFVTKLAPAGSLLYSALVGSLSLPNGGEGPTGPGGIAVDSAGNAYLAGAAGSLWPTTPGAYQPTIPLSISNTGPFVSKLAADGSHLLFSTFIGTGYATALALDPSNNVLFTGYANDNTYPLTPDATQGPNGCCAYLSKLSADGSTLLYSSFLQSDQRTTNQVAFSGTQPSAIRLDTASNIWIAGQTADRSLPLLHPLQSVFPTDTRTGPGFLSEFDPTGKTLKFSTYYGGAATVINSLSIAPSGIVNIAGTTSTGIDTTPNSLISSITPAPPDYTYNYGFLARINPAQSSPALCVADSLSGPPGVQTLVGTPDTLSLLITSCGELPLTISSIQSSSPLFTVADPTAACGSSLAPGAACTVSITFLPTHSGTGSATLTLLSNASIPTATISLTATGIPLTPSFSSTSLSFTTTPGTAAPTQTITVTNVSDIPLTFLNSSYTQPFTLSNTCAPQLAPGLSCSILVGFLPPTAGTFTGSLYFSFLGNYTSDQTITLTGTAAAPAVTLGPTTPAAATESVVAGQPATYALSTTSVGNFSGTATFSCTGLPQYAACSFAPSAVTLAAGAATPITLTISTGGTTAVALHPSATRVSPGSLITLAVLGLPVLWISRRRASRLVRTGFLSLSLAVVSLASVALLSGCSGSSSGSSPSQPTPALTPAGTYTINVVATTTAATISTPVTLVVK